MPDQEQRISFTRASDGTQLAYATHGSGYPLVRAAHWLTHLQHDWESPVWRSWLTELGRRFRMLRYDERGCGLSDWDVDDFSLDAWVDDLETVVNAAGYERFALLGMSQGAPVAISYAVRHPERVSHLVIYGGYLLGWAKRPMDEVERQEKDASLTLMRIGWGRDNPAFRRLFTADFVPDGDEALLRAYDDLMRRTTSPDNAVRFELAFGQIDVTQVAPEVQVATLVMHLDDDLIVSFGRGRQVAAAIPGARFVQLHGRDHILQPRDEAWPEFLHQLEGFVGAGAVEGPAPRGEPLSARETQVLRLVGQGLSNQRIAAQLGLSVRTVERHLSNVYVKFDLTGKSARAAAAAREVELRGRDRRP
jgi:pimeloyl-ACP methyl ester carboxylesterase/DNA-binding CsgD family transcriptional regulator